MNLVEMLQQYEVARNQAHKEGVCIKCKQDASPRIHSEAGKREYVISGTCEECFDEMFKETL